MSITVSEKRIKSKTKIGEKVAVVENIRYPFFESEKHKKLCSKMNDFYLSVARKYSYYVRKRLPKKLKLGSSAFRMPVSVSMNYTIALCNEKTVSVVIDLVFGDGKNTKTRRFSQMWSIKRGDILPINELIRTDRQSKKKIYSLVTAKAEENDAVGSFGYFDDYLFRLSRNFNLKNCFVVPNGICFFINAGILAPIKYGSSSFILSFERVSDIVNQGILPDEVEK